MDEKETEAKYNDNRDELGRFASDGSSASGGSGNEASASAGDKYSKTYPKTKEGRNEKLSDLAVGDTIEYSGGEYLSGKYEVLSVDRHGGAQNKTDVFALKEGKERYTNTTIRFGPRAGEPIQIDNKTHFEFSNQGGENSADKFSFSPRGKKSMDETKIGAEISQRNREKIQAAHDALAQLGARCAASPEVTEIAIASLGGDDLVTFGGAVKATRMDDGRVHVRGPLVVFTSPDEPDLTGQDYFDATTDFGIDEYPAKSAAYFNHGQDIHFQKRRLSPVTLTKDEFGIWADGILSEIDEYEKFLVTLAEMGKLGMSSGVPAHLVEREPVGKAMHIKTWPLGLDASYTHTPAESKTRRVVTLKSLLPVEAEAATDRAAPEAVIEPQPILETEVKKMDPEDIKKIVSDAITEYRKSEPAEKSVASVTVTRDAADQPWRSAGEFFQAVKNAALYPSQRDVRLDASKAITGMGEQVPADGGYLVSSTIANGIIERMYKTGEILNRVSKDAIGPGSNGMTYNRVDETSRVDGSRWGGIRAYWLAEGSTKTASAPKFAQLELKLKKVAALAYATDELLQDATALEGWINRTVPQEIAFKVEDAIYNGDGVGKPLGIMGGPALVSPFRVDANKVQAADIITMWSRRYSGLNDYVWLINPDVIPQLMTVAGTYQYLWMPPGGLSGSPYGTIFGRPVIEVEYCPTMGTTGDIMLASLSQYQAIDKGGVQAASSIHVAFLTDQSVFRFVYRFDGAPLWHSALTPFKGSNTVSPYVVLATASA